MSTVRAVTPLADHRVVAPHLPPLAVVPAPATPPFPSSVEPASRLPREWVEVHGVEVDGDTIDTLLIGPNGLFAVHFDEDPRPAAVRPGFGLIRAGTREPNPVKRALGNAEALRQRLAHLPGDLFPYPVLVTATTGEAGHRLGRLLVVRPGRLAEALWRHASRPLRRSEREAVREALVGSSSSR
jgi:hypothetical protein